MSNFMGVGIFLDWSQPGWSWLLAIDLKVCLETGGVNFIPWLTKPFIKPVHIGHDK